MKHPVSISGLTILAASLLVSSLPAQKRQSGPLPPMTFGPIVEEGPSGSHRRLGNKLEDLLRPEEILGQRLARSRQHRDQQARDDELNADLGKLARKLLEDKEFVRSLQGMSREELDQLKNQLRQRGFSRQDPKLKDLLKQGEKSLGKLDPQDTEILKRWKEKMREPNGSGGPGENPLGGGTQPPTGQPAVPPVMPGGISQRPTGELPPWQQDPSRAADWFKRSLDGIVKNMDQWVGAPGGKSWSDLLKNLARRAEGNKPSANKLGERATNLSKWLAKITGANTARVPRLGNPRLPNLPRFGSLPTFSVARPRSLAGPAQLVVVLACLGFVALLLWRGRDWFTALQVMRKRAWRLGPWPVRPESVSTRGDLVRAFEYLALLRLGPDARTCHHLELAQRIGSQPALDAERRQQSAELLARLYEQARYTPDAEPLPADDLRQARRELAYLAGTAA